MINLATGYFIAMANQIGIVDPFVTYGRELERMYYAFFNANSAAYTIFYFLLAFLAIDRISPYTRRLRWIGLITMAILIILTGGRGAILICGALALALRFSDRSTRAVFVIIALTIGWIVVLPIYSSLVEIFLLREESNSERLTATLQYLALVREGPLFGHGVELLRERAELLGFKSSHNFFIEAVAMFGWVLGALLIAYLFVTLTFGPRDNQLRVLGFFALMPGLFNNTLLTNWGFIPLAVPVLMLCAGQNRRGLKTRQSPVGRHQQLVRQNAASHDVAARLDASSDFAIRDPAR